MDLKELAAEREARAKARVGAPMPNPWPASKAPARVQVGKSQGAELLRVHRSIRFAHSLGLVTCVIGILLMLLMSSRTWGVLVIFFGILLARMGGSSVHGMLPALLQESHAPTQAEVDASIGIGLFGFAGIKDLGNSLAVEWATLLENLAFACTYGKRNCLTSQMYAGDITLGKICSLVWGKLSSGVLQCN
ncbi:unnamed protein product [Polarella glacialis]|uniref:Uncharacterized protein n=1 Tax=Polarella glacialis TaxID=89957 RepID=A0A813K858_POLGL|nr:unnamed protein product [Polarella glacialis]